MTSTLAVTGHRPDKLGGYDRDTYDQLRYFAEFVLERESPSLVITGMAQGWDHAVASAAMLMHVPFHAYVPFEGQESVWPDEAQKRYRAILKRADSVIVVSSGEYAAWKMQRRNEAMVDALTGGDDKLVALYDGSSGGTANCLDYAERKHVRVLNMWAAWERWRKEGS